MRMGSGIVFFDIDGTLCRYSRSVSNELKESFHRFHAKRNVAFLCTGRSPIDIQPDILNLGFDGIIGLMGAYISVGGKLIQNKFIPYELLEDTIEALISHKAQAFVLGRNTYARTAYARDYDWDIPVFHGIQDLYVDGQRPEIASIDLDFEKIEDAQIYLTSLNQHSEFIQYSEVTGQTRLHGVSKSKAMQKVLSLPQYKGLTSFAIGDSQNDMDMLEFADIGIAMGDAPTEVAACAKWQTSTVENHGVGRALEHFHLL